MKFTRERYLIWDESKNREDYFPYEGLYWNHIEAYRPWEHPETHINHLFNEWRKSREKGIEQVSARNNNTQTREFITYALSLLFSAIFWMNSCPVKLSFWQEELNNMKIQAMNAEERINFILSRPSGYHSFIQLAELFTEYEKLYYKALALQKLKKRV
ncbi:YpoC family protein [Peribacillus sp. SCS-155]|uniref:YpoC family protein n=1 Tax=Peribacillus sedimenti TaxID=3115297 RepID=UPI003905BC08